MCSCRYRHLLKGFAVALNATLCLVAAAVADDPPWIVRSRTGVVASDSPSASRIGADVLAAGGNAFDAAVATSFALTVARPESTGLGGGGFMLAYVASEKRFVVLDFREVAPGAATRAYYEQLASADANTPPPTIYGPNAVGVPGLLAGLNTIATKYGTRKLGELVAPAVVLCDTGFAADLHLVDAATRVLRDYEKWPVLKEKCGTLYHTLLGNGKAPAVGDTIRRPELVKTLKLIGRYGPDVFYDGPLGEAVVRTVQSAGGRMSPEDLKAYKVREREPLRGGFGEYEIVTMPPPSSGGLCLLEALNLYSAAKVRSDLHPERDRPHLLAEILKHAFADRARFLGDADFVQVPVERLGSMPYAVGLMQRIQFGKVLEAPNAYGSQDVPATLPARDGGTSHFCIADKHGNVVSMTETINGFFGSLLVAEPTGIILNNEMDDFATAPGKPNLFGLVQSSANAVEPGKRPLSSMCPTIVLKEGKPVLTLGASGGPRIITSVLNVMLNVLDRQMPLDAAIDAPRLHHQWLPNEISFDRTPPAEVINGLKAAGHKISEKNGCGVLQAIQWLADGTMVGASDPRKDGRPATPDR